ncbi:MAG: hypothetical protein NTU80_02775 [Verrucomicrobia bacterium]|nr:hypothetical protein [Verrucomicrobiota bacterium]
MTTRKTTSSTELRPEPKVLLASNQLRAKSNGLNDDKRSELLQRGLDLIYGHGRNTPANAGRR